MRDDEPPAAAAAAIRANQNFSDLDIEMIWNFGTETSPKSTQRKICSSLDLMNSDIKQYLDETVCDTKLQ